VRDTKNYYDIPFNPSLCERAKELRKAANLSEVLLWKRLNKGRFKGFDFDRQKIIGNYIVDLYCVDCRVVIEIDGKSHENKIEYDSERNAFLEGLGLTVIHINADDVLERIDSVMFWLYDHPALRAPLQGGE
jgi:very-short-patch-repair endonuclease